MSHWELGLVQMELKRLVAKWHYEHPGQGMSSSKAASLMANAIFIVRYVRTGKVRSWKGNYWKRRRLWERIHQRRDLERFQAKPIWERRKYLNIG